MGNLFQAVSSAEAVGCCGDRTLQLLARRVEAIHRSLHWWPSGVSLGWLDLRVSGCLEVEAVLSSQCCV